MTSYGTQIFWPLTNERYATDWLSIVDPLLTLPWLVLFILLIVKRDLSLKFSRGALIYTLIYILFCGYQHNRAKTELLNYAAEQQLQVQNVRLLPTLANSFWFRGLLLSDGRIHVHGVLVRPFAEVKIRPGKSVKHIKVTDISGLNQAAQKQLNVWKWFTQDWMYLHEDNPNQFGDGRYSMRTTDFSSLWVFELNSHDVSKSRKRQNNFQNSDSDRNLFEGYNLLFNPEPLDDVR